MSGKNSVKAEHFVDRIIFNALLLLLIIGPVSCFGQKLFFLQEEGYGQTAFVKENKISTYSIIYEKQFVTNSLLDEKKLKDEVIRRFPDVLFAGYAVLDWEGEGMKAIEKQNDIKKFRLYTNQFVRALNIVKELRPKMKWAFYGIPFREYWNIDDSFIMKNYKIAEILKNQDFISPSLYNFYPDRPSFLKNSEYIRKNVSLALEMGIIFKKPVIPFIWHRVHPSNHKYGEQLLPISVFEDEIAQILKISFKNNKVYGLMWWQSENYTYLNRSKSFVFSKEYSNILNIGAYQKNMFQRYYNVINRYLDKKY